MNEALSKTGRAYLMRLLKGPRFYTSSDPTYLGLERRGYLKRTGRRPLKRLMSHDVIEWEITDKGRIALERADA